MYDRDLGVYFSRSATAQQPQVMDKKKTKKWKKKKRVEVDGGPDLRLHRAETAHDLKKLLVKVVDHNELDANGDTPVHSYVRRRDKEKFKCLMTMLIHGDCDVNMPNKDGQTALHLACEANDVNFIKALIAFDAKLNSINNSYLTPLDILKKSHHDAADIIFLLEQLGGASCDDLFYSDDDIDSGPVSPYVEMDVAQEFEESHDYRPRSIHHSTGSDVAEKSPSPSHQYHSPSPVGQLPSLPEEDEDDILFKTAVDFSMLVGTQTDSISDREDLPFVTAKDEVAEERQSPISTQEPEKLTDPREESYPISPDASVEMAITRFSVIRLQELKLIESTDLEDSVSSVSSTSVLERTAFLQDSIPLMRSGGPPSLPLVEASHRLDSINTRETLMAQAYNELYSPKDSPAVAGVAAGFGAAVLEETDGAKSLEQPQEPTIEVASPSPDHLRYEGHSDGQHVRFNVNEDQKGNQLHLPLSFGEDGRSKEKRRMKKCLRQPSSEGPMRSLSIYNPQMDVLTSIIGHSVVHRTSENIGGQKILCLDGGGVKGLIQIEILKTIEQMTGKSISELFDWVVGTSTGGILALGMIYGGLSLPQLRCIYFEMKDTVFKQQSKFISHTCDTNALEELLKRMLGTDQRMDAIKKPNVLITAVDKRTTKLPLVFFNNCFDDDGKKSIRNEFVWKAARYTSAAPVFFAECDNYVDGGVVANNPTTFALPEIQEFLTRKHGYKSTAARISCVVSLGCGIYPPEPLGNTDITDALKITKLLSAPRRLGDLLTLLTTALGGSEEMARLCRINCEQQGISYFRFSPEIGEDVGTTEKDNRKLCEIIIRAKALFMENSEQVKEMIRLLGCSVQDEYLYHV